MTDREVELAEAMRAGRRGDNAAYARALADIARAIRPRVRRKLGAAGEETEDTVQEVLLAIHVKNGTWDETLPLLPWAFAIADHKAIDMLRRRRRASRFISDAVSAEDAAEFVAQPTPELDATGLDLDRHLAALPLRQQQVLRGIAIEGGTIALTAARLGIREGAVRVALHRALKRLARSAQTDAGAPDGTGERR